MVFSLEALQAFHGDSLLCTPGDTAVPDRRRPVQHVGDEPAPAAGAAARRARAGRRPLRIDLAMVSHIDDDHIHGLTDMARRWSSSPTTASRSRT